MKRRIVIDNLNTNKQLRHYDHEADYMRLSVDETIARGLNAWPGWSCSAGAKNLYIDYDGNVWVCNTASASVDRFNHEGLDQRIQQIYDAHTGSLADADAAVARMERQFHKSDVAVRKVFAAGSAPGLLGNITDGFAMPKTWFRCQWQQCGCGADVFLPKARDEHLAKLAVHHGGYSGQSDTKDRLVDHVDDIVATEPNFPIPWQILWDIGRRCNYDCSYCWSSAHNRDAEHKPLELLQSTADQLITRWADNGRIRWNFGGGEPTLNPAFLDFLRYLKTKDQWVLVTSNGSRPRSYWRQAIPYINSVNLSVHFEYVDEAKMLDNIAEICDHFDRHADDHWLEIKLMSLPQFIERAVALRDTINAVTTLATPGANDRIKGVVSIVPIRSTDGSTLIEYSDDVIKLIQNQ